MNKVITRVGDKAVQIHILTKSIEIRGLIRLLNKNVLDKIISQTQTL
jgi:hypothetical protein